MSIHNDFPFHKHHTTNYNNAYNSTRKQAAQTLRGTPRASKRVKTHQFSIDISKEAMKTIRKRRLRKKGMFKTPIEVD